MLGLPGLERPPVWIIGAVAVALVISTVYETTGGPAATPYSAFLDQLDAGNVASLTFEGTKINGRFKHPVTVATANGAAPVDAFRSRLPDFGGSSLISELRKQHASIDVTSASSWTRWAQIDLRGDDARNRLDGLLNGRRTVCARHPANPQINSGGDWMSTCGLARVRL